MTKGQEFGIEDAHVDRVLGCLWCAEIWQPFISADHDGNFGLRGTSPWDMME